MDKQVKAVAGDPHGMWPLPPFSGFSGSAIRAAIWPIEFWLQWQADVLKVAAPATAEWMARRREGAEAALQALHRLCDCADVNDAARVQNEWVSDETKRIESDFRSLSDSVLFWPQAAAKAGRYVMQTERAA